MIDNDYDKIKDFIELDGEIENEERFNQGKKWSFDLKIGKEYFLSGDNAPNNLGDENKYLVIKPGKFAILSTQETVSMPHTHMAFINLKFSYKKKGIINVSGFHVDPNYTGKIIFTVFNAGPNDVYIKEDDYVFMIFFIELTKKYKLNSSKIKDEWGENEENDREQKKGYEDIPQEMFESIGRNSLTLMENNKRIEQLEFYMKVIIAPIVLVGITLIGTYLINSITS